MDSASEGRYDGATLLDGLRACTGISCRRSSVRDVHVHATVPVVDGDWDLGRIVGLDHRHLEHLHATSLSHPCSTLTSIACRFCAPSPARSLCERLQFGGLLRLVGHGVPHSVVLLIICASLRSGRARMLSSPCRTSPRVPRQPRLDRCRICRRQPRTSVCSWSSSLLPRRPGPRARRSPPCCRRRRARRSPPCCRCYAPPMAPALQSESRLAAMGGLSMKRRASGSDTPEMKRCHGGHNECAFRVME